MLCYNCQEDTDHATKNCPNLQCKYCSQKGHAEKHCPIKIYENSEIHSQVRPQSEIPCKRVHRKIYVSESENKEVQQVSNDLRVRRKHEKLSLKKRKKKRALEYKKRLQKFEQERNLRNEIRNEIERLREEKTVVTKKAPDLREEIEQRKFHKKVLKDPNLIDLDARELELNKQIERLNQDRVQLLELEKSYFDNKDIRKSYDEEISNTRLK